ncbi:type VI secretion system baseplate subunit TssG [Acerihabitans sp. TG2]|uniref:type VI secretion system baseplate subunit TssG n=1 Tax=Acerihabitans sp. TG2 TaxID=3096008 RepID=UPI002B23ECFA|nr:type VI secretion system baseplate subunit TssG [Acerihabitans sp. TG2]MEA9389771.1 type VI secretion system baseplate subunit TssG [Acerihabitans sp. TG2]
MNDTHNNDKILPAFWQDSDGHDRAHQFNFYRFCQIVEQLSPDKAPLGSTFSLEQDAVRFRPHPGMGFPVSTLNAVETDPDHPERPPTVRTTFMGLYGVDSPLPTGYIDDIAQRRDGHEGLEAFLDIFNHRMMTQFYRIWRKYHYPATFEAGGSDKTSRCLMALTGIMNGPSSHLLALLQPLMRTTRTAEGIVSVIKTHAPHTQVTVTPHQITRMSAGSQRARLSLAQPQRLGDKLILGRQAKEANYLIGVALYTEDPAEAKSWLPGGPLHEDVFALLGVYLGCDYDASLKLTIPTTLAPLPQLGNRALLAGYNAVLGLRGDNLAKMPAQVTMNLGRLRGKKNRLKPTT